MTEEDLIGLPVAKVPDWHDMDWGQFRGHWMKRHAPAVNTWDGVAEKYQDDDVPIWWAIRMEHDRIHQGRGRRLEDPMICPIPTDHIHLERVDPEIQRLLEELI